MRQRDAGVGRRGLPPDDRRIHLQRLGQSAQRRHNGVINLARIGLHQSTERVANQVFDEQQSSRLDCHECNDMRRFVQWKLRDFSGRCCRIDRSSVYVCQWSYSEHIDASRFATPRYQAALADFLSLKYRDEEPAIVIAGRRLGLVSMREWLESAGGSLTVRSHPAGGTRLEGLVPLPASDTWPSAAVE